MRIADLAPGDVILDLGCGAGFDLLLAAFRVGPTGRVLALDVADEMMDAARARVAAAGLATVEVRKGVLEDLPVAGASVDWVVSNCVLSLLPDQPLVFAEIARVLKPGGRLRIADIVVGDLGDRVRHDERLHGSCIAEAISEADYVAGLRNAGLIDLALGDRYVYDRDQLAAIVAGGGRSPGEALRAANALVGRVWLVHIAATKPPLEHQET